jgi:beta-lactamase class A
MIRQTSRLRGDAWASPQPYSSASRVLPMPFSPSPADASPDGDAGRGVPPITPPHRHRVVAPQASHLEHIERTLRRIAERAAGRIGIAVRHLESGDAVSVRGGDRFPMASVYKLPIAIQLLSMVDRGEISLDIPVTVTLADLRPGYSPLGDTLADTMVRRLATAPSDKPADAATLPLGTLLARMVAHSDNTASDLVLHRAGGPAAVTARLRSLGISEMRVDRPESQLLLDFYGVSSAPPAGRWTLAEVERRMDAVRPLRRRAAAERFARDPRDTATPDAMATLLARLQRGELLSPRSTERLLSLMTETPTGASRLKGLLPRGTSVAHKTGTTGSTGGRTAGVNDAGIITLPDGTHLVVVVFVKDAPGDVPTAETAIARLARTAYEHWTRG